MKLEHKEKQMLFSNTQLPDIFMSEYLPQMPGDTLKLYLYLLFLSKYDKDINLNDLSKKLSLPIKSINEGFDFLSNNNLLIKTTSGYIISDVQEETLHKLYKPNLTLSKKKIEQTSENKVRAKAIDTINNTYFQGVMSPLWYNDLDLWFTKYEFEPQVMIALFDYCYNRSALHRKYVQAVADAWGNTKIKTWNDLDSYWQKQEKNKKIKKSIAKKLGKHSGLTQYEEAYIDKWLNDYDYGMDIIEIALKRTTFKQNPNFEYLNKLLSDWHERNLKQHDEIIAFIEQRKKQKKNEKELKESVKKSNFEQRNYDDLDFLYANSAGNN